MDNANTYIAEALIAIFFLIVSFSIDWLFSDEEESQEDEKSDD